MSDILNAFTFHGVSFILEGSNAKADCPFCGKQNHFFVETKTGKYNCRRCSNEGNLYTFLEELWRISGDKPGLKRLETLAADRGIPVDEFQAWGLRVNALDSTAFILPQYNLKGRIANLSKIVKVDGKWKVYGTPTCKLHCFGTNLLQKQQTILWVCEGPWDAMALRRALQTVRFTGTQWVAHKGDQIALKTNGVIAVPGAGTFVTEYLQWFAGRDVRLVYDNDHPSQREGSTRKVQPGWDGMQRVLKIARNEDHQATKLQVLVWGKGGFDQELADGYDIRDLLQAPDLTTPQALAYLCSRLAEPKEKSDAKQVATTAEIVPPIACASFDELCKHFKQHLYLSDAFHDTLAVSLATVVSTNHDGEQLFFRIIGPPGCLAGQTKVLIRRHYQTQGRAIRLDRLYHYFNQVPLSHRRGEATPWHLRGDSFIQSYDPSSGAVFFNRVKRIIQSGSKKVLRLLLTDNEELYLTADHRVMLPDGNFIRAGKLRKGMKVLTRGSMKPQSIGERKEKIRYVEVDYLKYYRSGKVRNDEGRTYKRQTISRLTVEADLNKLSLSEYIWRLKNDPEAIHLKCLPDYLHVHHKDENPYNDALDNLEPLTQAEHNRRHDPKRRFNIEYTRIEKVKSIWTEVDEQMTYDIEVEGPCHNFSTAKGLFVHNSGKTTIAECLSVAREFCFPKSIITGFHSGFTGGRGGAKQEASLIPEMNGKCVVIKDADTLVNANNKDTILAELRDIYDGSSRSHYRNKKKADFEHLRTTFLLCGTDALRGLNRSFLGERFLDCDILGDADTTQYLATAVASQIASMQHSLTGASNEARGIHQKILKQVTYGYLLNLHQRIKAGEIKMPHFGSAEVTKRLESMAVLLSYTRAKVEREREELAYRPRTEIATRLVKQFVKLAVCLAIVMNKETIDKQVMNILAKVTIDTAYGFPFEIAHFLYNKTQGAPVAVIASHLDLAETTVKRNLTDMQELGTVTRRHEKNKSGIGGRDAHYYYLSQEVRELFKLSELPRNLTYLRTG